jgi:hypothetical protein
MKRKEPNEAPEPTPPSVTSCAAARLAPAGAVLTCNVGQSMFTRMLLGFITIVGAAVAGENSFVMGSTELTLPPGWRKIAVQDGGDRVNFLSPAGDQQLTLSIMRFGRSPSFEDFKRLCDLRIRAEKEEAPSVNVKAEAPFEEGEVFMMIFTGDEKTANRIFSGHLSVAKKELLTIYLEGVGVDPQKHREAFQALVKNIARK